MDLNSARIKNAREIFGTIWHASRRWRDKIYDARNLSDTRFMQNYKVPKILNPGSVENYSSYFAITVANNPAVVNGDTIRFICFNFTADQYEFLKEFDNNTSSDDTFGDNIYDQLKVPANLPTNIEPSNKAAGYFFIYSVSEISKVFKEQ